MWRRGEKEREKEKQRWSDAELSWQIGAEDTGRKKDKREREKDRRGAELLVQSIAVM